MSLGKTDQVSKQALIYVIRYFRDFPLTFTVEAIFSLNSESNSLQILSFTPKKQQFPLTFEPFSENFRWLAHHIDSKVSLTLDQSSFRWKLSRRLYCLARSAFGRWKRFIASRDCENNPWSMCNNNSGYNYGGNFEKQLLAAGISQTDLRAACIFVNFVLEQTFTFCFEMWIKSRFGTVAIPKSRTKARVRFLWFVPNVFVFF